MRRSRDAAGEFTMYQKFCKALIYADLLYLYYTIVVSAYQGVNQKKLRFSSLCVKLCAFVRFLYCDQKGKTLKHYSPIDLFPFEFQ